MRATESEAATDYGNAAGVLRVTMDVNAANHFSSHFEEPSFDELVQTTRRQ